MHIQNAIIDNATLTTGERGFLDCWLTLSYGGGTCQGFGGYTLYLPKSWKHHNILSVAGHHIFRIMEICGVENWKDVVGKSIRVRGEGDTFNFTLQAIGHIIKEDWYCPADDFAIARKQNDAQKGIES